MDLDTWMNPMLVRDALEGDHLLLWLVDDAESVRETPSIPDVEAVDVFLRADDPTFLIPAICTMGPLLRSSDPYRANLMPAQDIRDLVEHRCLVDPEAVALDGSSVLLPRTKIDGGGTIRQSRTLIGSLRRVTPVPTLSRCGIIDQLSEGSLVVVDPVDGWFAARNLIVSAIALARALEAHEHNEIQASEVFPTAGFTRIDPERASTETPLWARPLAQSSVLLYPFCDSREEDKVTKGVIESLPVSRFLARTTAAPTTLLAAEADTERDAGLADAMLTAISRSLDPVGVKVCEGQIVPVFASVAASIWERITHLEDARALVCPHCGRAFLAKNKRTRFCSNSCRTMEAKSRNDSNR